MSWTTLFLPAPVSCPQKKNPDIAELVRGKAGRVFGDVMTLLAVMKSLPLAYNKDMQEDKDAIFDAFDTVKLCLTAFIPMVDTMTVLPQNMRKAAAGGFINATDCADFLVGKACPSGMPTRQQESWWPLYRRGLNVGNAAAGSL